MCVCLLRAAVREGPSVVIETGNDNQMEAPWETPTFIPFENFLPLFLSIMKSEKMFKEPSLVIIRAGEGEGYLVF